MTDGPEEALPPTSQGPLGWQSKRTPSRQPADDWRACLAHHRHCRGRHARRVHDLCRGLWALVSFRGRLSSCLPLSVRQLTVGALEGWLEEATATRERSYGVSTSLPTTLRPETSASA